MLLKKSADDKKGMQNYPLGSSTADLAVADRIHEARNCNSICRAQGFCN